jgi:hypothetical protein
MKEFTFRVTQPLSGYYEGEVTVKASSEKAARNKLNKMTQEELEEICTSWEQGDEMSADGDIEIDELKSEES